MKKVLTLLLFGVFLSTGIYSGLALADELKMVNYQGIIGQLNFETKPANQFVWGYCLEEYTYSYPDIWYEYQLRDLAGYSGDKSRFGFIAADLIWLQYQDGNVSADEKTKLQYDIWNAYTNYDLTYSLNFSNELLESLFSIAYVPNFNIVGNNLNPWGQDFIVYSPVPEPVSMLLFGTGLVGVGGYVRRKFKK